VRLVVPLIAVPTLTVALFAGADLLHRAQGNPVVTVEAVFMIPVVMTAFTALAAIVGLHFSLLSRKTVQAVMISTAVVMGGAGLLTACGWAMRGTNVHVAGAVLPFTPVWSVQALLDPWEAAERASPVNWSTGSSGVSPRSVVAFRVTRTLFSLIAATVYLAITYALYSSMVRGFDMTVRRQST